MFRRVCFRAQQARDAAWLCAVTTLGRTPGLRTDAFHSYSAPQPQIKSGRSPAIIMEGTQKRGVCEIHRTSYAPVVYLKEKIWLTR